MRPSLLIATALLAVAACAGGDGDGDAAASRSSAIGTVASTTAAPPAVTEGAAPTVPTTTTVATPPPTTGIAPQGFELVAGRVTAADGSTCDVCLWLAAAPEDRARGLMGVTDLSGADGMVFTWDLPTTSAFWMRDTPTPLSIAFFAEDGTFVSAADMAPCLQPTPDVDCPRYPAAGPFSFAVEVALGGLEALLIGPGSRLDLLAGGCPG